MSESLEWLNYYKQIIVESNKTFRPNGFDIIEKELKALEIIRKKGVSVWALTRSDSVEKYNSIRNSWEYNVFTFVKELTKEEYDLLKEVLL